jgi:hypothetical protein
MKWNHGIKPTTMQYPSLFPSSDETHSTWAWSIERIQGKIENEVFITICVRRY